MYRLDPKCKLTLGPDKGPYIMYDRNFLAFLASPSEKNDVIVTKEHDITVTYTDCNSHPP